MFLEDLTAVLKSLPACSLLVGDVNIDLNPNNDSFYSHTTRTYLDILSNFEFFNTISTPTRFGDHKNSIIDHLIVNRLKSGIKTCTVDYLLADHQPCIGSVDICTHRPKQKLSVYTKTNYVALKENLESQDWNSIIDGNCSETSMKNFLTTFNDIAKSSSCEVKSKVHKINFKQPWMTPTLYSLLQKRSQLHAMTKKEPFNDTLKTKYCKFRNYVSNTIKSAKTSYLSKKFEECKSNNNEKWKFITNLITKKDTEQSPSLIKKQDDAGTTIEITEPSEIVESFNEFFVSVGEKLASTLPESPRSFDYYFEQVPENRYFEFYEIGPPEILSIIDSLETKKATGHDMISTRAIKENRSTLLPVLVELVNLIIKCSHFPDSIKIARVKPLFKKGCKYDMTNYRPISILSCISKIAEKVLCNQIREHLENNDLLTVKQYGFRPMKNTSLAINDFLEQIYRRLDQSLETQAIFLDFSKAFDTINHDILLGKLRFYNFNDSAIKLIKSYLTNRKQFVKIESQESTLKSISLGVPQGSVLGPLLFLIYINDLVNVSPAFNYILFADDTNLLCDNHLFTQSELVKIQEWCCANKLIINFSKTQQIIFRNPQKRIQLDNYEIQDLKIVDHCKFLGVVLDQHCRFNFHIEGIIHKISFLLMMFRFLTRFFDEKTMVNLYYSFIYPHLIYGIEFWGHAPEYLISKLLISQKKALRVIVKQPPNSHISHKFNDLKIMPISMLFKFRLVIFYNRHVLSIKDNYNLTEKDHQMVTRKNLKNPIKTIKIKSEKGKRSMFFTAANLYGELAWDLRDLPCGVFGKQLAARLWELGG